MPLGVRKMLLAELPITRIVGLFGVIAQALHQILVLRDGVVQLGLQKVASGIHGYSGLSSDLGG
jgi:hypothetical protein